MLVLIIFIVCRTWDPCWAQIHVFCSESIANWDSKVAKVLQSAFAHLLTLALEFAVAMATGYSDCLVRVTSRCRLRRDVLRRRGFVVIATIPNSVNVEGVGMCDDLLFAKSLQLADRPVCALSWGMGVDHRIDRGHPPNFLIYELRGNIFFVPFCSTSGCEDAGFLHLLILEHAMQ